MPRAHPPPAIAEPAIAALRTRLRGALLRPGDADYAIARSIWNGMTTRQPALIARARGVTDVVACVDFAREHGLPVSVRGGGHNVAGAALCDGGLTIDMSTRRGVRVDPTAPIVRVEAGATWGDVDHESLPVGLVVPSGIVSTTGVAGLTLGGGFGWTSRRFGFTADNLRSFDIVTADGRLRRASATEDAELFWAARGGGGHFGVVTSFEFEAHRFGPRALCGLVVHPLDALPAVARRLRDVCAGAPDDLTCLMVLRHAPPAPFLPPDVHGRPIVAVGACWTGDPAAGEAALRPLRDVGRPIADTIGPKPFVAHQTMFDAAQPFGRRYYWKSHFCGALADGFIDALGDHGAALPSPHSAVLLMQLGGAPRRTDPGASAVAPAMREAAFVVNFQAAWDDAAADAEHHHWALGCWRSAAPFSTGSVYVNFMTGDEGEARMQAAYGDAVHARLRAIKAQWDPDDVFQGAQRIAPAPAD